MLTRPQIDALSDAELAAATAREIKRVCKDPDREFATLNGLREETAIRAMRGPGTPYVHVTPREGVSEG